MVVVGSALALVMVGLLRTAAAKAVVVVASRCCCKRDDARDADARVCVCDVRRMGNEAVSMMVERLRQQQQETRCCRVERSRK